MLPGEGHKSSQLASFLRVARHPVRVDLTNTGKDAAPDGHFFLESRRSVAGLVNFAPISRALLSEFRSVFLFVELDLIHVTGF